MSAWVESSLVIFGAALRVDGGRARLVGLESPSLSVAVTTTVWLVLCPDGMLSDQAQEPSAFFTTVPVEALRVTSSAPGSDHVPVIVAVCPSVTATELAAAATLGGAFSTFSAKPVTLESPSLSVAVMVTICDSSGPSVGVNVQVQV